MRSTTRRRNPGHSPLRQALAPQPDSLRSGQNGMRPADHHRRAGGRPGGAVGAYGGFLDRQNPNIDRPLAGGLNDAQVKWMKRNLLGRSGPVTGQEGRRFQNQMGRYIKGAGGQDAFQQMLGGMPGFGARQGGPGAPMANRFKPTSMGMGAPGGRMGPGGKPQYPGGMPIGNLPTPTAPAARTLGAQTGQMFPQQAQQQTLSFDPAKPPSRVQLPEDPTANQPQRPGAQRPQNQQGPRKGTAGYYGGETDPRRQARNEGERWRKRGIPLTPEVEQGMRDLTDQYIQTMIEIGYTEADAAAQVEMVKERLATDFTQAQGQADESAADRGMFHSGGRLKDQGDVATAAGRGFQDLATQAAQQERAIADAKAAAIEAMRAGRQELAMSGTRSAVARAASGSPHSGLRTGRRGRKSGRRRGTRG